MVSQGSELNIQTLQVTFPSDFIIYAIEDLLCVKNIFLTIILAVFECILSVQCVHFVLNISSRLFYLTVLRLYNQYANVSSLFPLAFGNCHSTLFL